MSAGVCGKRVGFEEIFGSSSSSAKRSRCSGFRSPTRSSEFGSGSEDTVFSLLQMFPALDPEVHFNVNSFLSHSCNLFNWWNSEISIIALVNSNFYLDSWKLWTVYFLFCISCNLEDIIKLKYAIYVLGFTKFDPNIWLYLGFIKFFFFFSPPGFHVSYGFLHLWCFI